MCATMTAPDPVALRWLIAHGFVPESAATMLPRLESGCTDCGRRLVLDSEVSVCVCGTCQDVFLRSVAQPPHLTADSKTID